MSIETFDVAAVRAHYPALSDGWAYLDGAAGTQVPNAVIEATARAYRSGIGNHGGAFAASVRSDRYVAEARSAIADLVGAVDSNGVVLGPNATSLNFRLAQALSATWRAGDEVVISRLDHDANVRPWLIWAERVNATVRWVEPQLPSTDLEPEAYDGVVGERTRLVAVTAASNLTGSIPDVAAIAKRAHAVGATIRGGRRARHPAHTYRHGGAWRGRVADVGIQVVRPAYRRDDRRPGVLGATSARQACAVT